MKLLILLLITVLLQGCAGVTGGIKDGELWMKGYGAKSMSLEDSKGNKATLTRDIPWKMPSFVPFRN